MGRKRRKPFARVLGWESGRHKTRSGKPRMIVPSYNVHSWKQVPQSAKSVTIVTFKRNGKPKGHKTIQRNDLKNFRVSI